LRNHQNALEDFRRAVKEKYGVDIDIADEEGATADPQEYGRLI
jgi:hypothetical protein